jgi:regulatory protein
MRITKIETQKENPSRRNLYADGKFLLGVSAETLLRFGIRTGDEIGEEKLRALHAAEELQSAKAVALRLLARRPRTEKEVRDKLREKEFADAEIIATIEHLRTLGFLNDEEFARTYIAHQLAMRPKGKLALRQHLLMLGIKKETVDAVLGEVLPEAKQEDAALKAAQAFLRRTSRSRDDPQKSRQKLAAFLNRRGFTWDIIAPTVKTVLGEKASEDE